MKKFNLCEAFFSGYYFFREEFASSALGYALSPFASGSVEPLKFFIRMLLETQDKYQILLKKILTRLEADQHIDWENSFAADPLSSSAVIASALEFNEIDILLRVDDVILLFENKIYEGSVGAIARQITNYKAGLPERFQQNIIPVAIFPKAARSDYDDIVALSWNGSENFTVCKFFQELAENNTAFEDFVQFIQADFSSTSRPAVSKHNSYNELVNKFEDDFPQIIRELFPEENYAPGDDMCAGGCLLYRLPLPNSKEECFPFRLMINGKCEILYQGLRKKVFLNGYSFDGKHTIRDIMKEFLIKRGVKFTTRYHFSYRQFACPETRQAFADVLALLARIDREEWDKTDFAGYYNQLTDTSVTLDDLKDSMNDEFVDLYKEKLLNNKKLLQELARVLNLIRTKEKRSVPDNG